MARKPKQTTEVVPKGDVQVLQRTDPNGDVHEIPIEVTADENGSAVVSPSERLRRAIQLRLAGLRWDRIAQECGYSSGPAACIAVSKALKELNAESVEELRRVMGARLEHMLMLLWPDVNTKDLGSMSMALSVMDRMARLYGLESPLQIQQSGTVEHVGAVLVVEGNQEQYIAAMRAARQAIEVKAGNGNGKQPKE